MGRTKRHERTDDERRFKKLKGRTNSKRKDRKNKAALSNFVSFRSQRSEPDDELIVEEHEEDCDHEADCDCVNCHNNNVGFV